MATLHELQAVDDQVTRAAAQAPKTHQEAFLTYFVKRREQLLAGLGDTASTFEAQRIAKHVRSLDKLVSTGGISLPKRRALKGAKPTPGSSGPENRLHLSRLLCPDGWQETVAGPFSALADETLKRIIDEENVEENLALYLETTKFLRYLTAVEQNGRAANAELARKRKARMYG